MGILEIYISNLILTLGMFVVLIFRAWIGLEKLPYDVEGTGMETNVPSALSQICLQWRYLSHIPFFLLMDCMDTLCEAENMLDKLCKNFFRLQIYRVVGL